MLCRKSSRRADRTPAAQEKTTRLPGSFGMAPGSKAESGSETDPGMCPAANSCGSRTSTRTMEPSAMPRFTASRSRSTIVGWFIAAKSSGGVRERVDEGRQAALQAQKRDALDLRHGRVEFLIRIMLQTLLEGLEDFLLRPALHGHDEGEAEFLLI